MAEGHGGRLATVLPADPDYEIRLRRTTALHCQRDHLADAFLVERHERIAGEDARLDVQAQEFRSVVSRQPEGRLGEVVGSEREEICVLRDPPRGERGPRE